MFCVLRDQGCLERFAPPRLASLARLRSRRRVTHLAAGGALLLPAPPKPDTLVTKRWCTRFVHSRRARVAAPSAFAALRSIPSRASRSSVPNVSCWGVRGGAARSPRCTVSPLRRERSRASEASRGGAKRSRSRGHPNTKHIVRYALWRPGLAKTPGPERALPYRASRSRAPWTRENARARNARARAVSTSIPSSLAPAARARASTPLDVAR
jgi:hypothetical protein